MWFARAPGKWFTACALFVDYHVRFFPRCVTEGNCHKYFQLKVMQCPKTFTTVRSLVEQFQCILDTGCHGDKEVRSLSFMRCGLQRYVLARPKLRQY
jgi:hypothetical protein